MTDNVEEKIGYIGARLREKSTYGGLAVLIGIFLPMLIAKFPDLAGANADTIATAIQSIGIGIGVLITVFLPEKGAKAVIAFLIIGIGILSAPMARAGDIASPTSAVTAINKALSSTNTCQAAGNCSGWYGVFGMGAQSNTGTPNILANGINSAFSDGLDIYAGGGYQLWNGQWLAGIELTGGYEFTSGGTKPAGGNFVGTEFVKLGYNFFPSSASTTPVPAQNPFLNLVSANFLANSTPAIIMGGVQRHGLSVAAIGMEIDTVISAGWSSYAQLYNSPSQQGLPSDTTLRIGLQKHF